ncbi:phage regulatory CII family protein [Burkholderia gladioli]|uniref:phage regulatory CII family protein n=1 Tax=Burkholderia gladioli TaxID=28095 RepID=UPI00163F80DE|nr:phage regulatory CII family protein [Burkholderia gladioli]
MTQEYSQTAWIDVLYTSVLNTPGKVEDAARYLSERRGAKISGEALRCRLREVDGVRLSAEMFELLVEWMLDKNQGHALDAVHAFNARFGLVAAPTRDDGDAQAVDSLLHSALSVSGAAGGLAEEVRRAAGDGVISAREAEAIERAGRVAQREIERTIGIAKRVAMPRRRRR